jgi:fructuronate reductase
VAGEPFRQWVIEDLFPGGRPAWEAGGAVLTDDVAPWEALKLRVLNAVHSALAYLGALAGRQTVAEAMAMPGARQLLTRFIAEDVAPTLTPPDGQCPLAYGQAALDRFTNPAIGHRTVQVAMDGSQKLPYRLLGTIADARAGGGQARWAALVLAAWMRFVRGVADDGTDLPLDDPLAERLRAAIAAAKDTPAGLADALFGIDEIFDPELVGDAPLRTQVVEWLTCLDRYGAAATIRSEGGTP